ncbi:TC1A-like protein [Mya arenaria]|uniref:TC1A-like protein n=1 Tax=Mya arenaria TaxID=6604 RepID=A0ABY7FVU6_MYAAR|nr:TC1A-like protein [Mya arenaria]
MDVFFAAPKSKLAVDELWESDGLAVSQCASKQKFRVITSIFEFQYRSLQEVDFYIIFKKVYTMGRLSDAQRHEAIGMVAGSSARKSDGPADYARPLSARLTTDFMTRQIINVLPWPAFSPDLSPIEHLWDQLGRRVYCVRHVINKAELVQALREEWNTIPQYRTQRLIRSMRRRCQSVLDANCRHIR